MRRIEFEHVQNDATNDRQVCRGVIALHSAGVFAQHHIEPPMQVDLDRPMSACGTGQFIRVEHNRSDVVACLDACCLDVRNAQRQGATQAGTLGPLLANDQSTVANHLRDLKAFSPMPIPDLSVGQRVGLVSKGVFKHLAQAWLVTFDRQQVVGAAPTDLPR